MAHFVPLAVPTTPTEVKDKNFELSEEHEKKRKEVLVHFDKDDYKIPGLPAEEKAELVDEEKMWLVSPSSLMNKDNVLTIRRKSNDCLLR